MLTVANKIKNSVFGGVRIFSGTIEFGTVARRQDGGFMNASHLGARKPLAQMADSFGNFIGAEGYALTNGNGRGSMVKTYSKQMHRDGKWKEWCYYDM